MAHLKTLLVLFCSTVLLVPALSYGQSPADDRAATIQMLPDLHLLQPSWHGDLVYRESCTPLQMQNDQPATGRLAFSIDEILSISTADQSRKLTLGQDYTIGENGQTLLFPIAAKLPMIRQSEMYIPKGSPNSYPHRVGNPEQHLLYGEGHYFHDRQIEVTYRRKPVKWTGKIPQLAAKNLPKTLARLKSGQPLTLGVSGDSITAGANASGLAKVAPNMPPYPDLVAAQLQATFGGEVKLRNRAVGGWSIANGVEDLDKLLAEKPQLIIMAYGMNDVGRRDPEWFKQQTKTFVDKVRATDPEIEIILVASMLGNAEWVHTPREMFFKYRDILAEFEGPGIALADVTDVWSTLLRSKHDFDLIGNGLNHPNDFGHRLYAQVILALMIEQQSAK